MEVPITEERTRAKGVLQCTVSEVEMPRTMAQLFKYEGPFKHLIERALNHQPGRADNKSSHSEAIPSHTPFSPPGLLHQEPQTMTTLYCVSGNGHGRTNMMFSDERLAMEYARRFGTEAIRKEVPTPKVILSDK